MSTWGGIGVNLGRKRGFCAVIVGTGAASDLSSWDGQIASRQGRGGNDFVCG